MLELTKEQKELLKKDFPAEALSKDTSRGFELTSIKAAYVVERLNDVFGIGGWAYTFTSFEQIGDEVCTTVTLVIKDKMEGHESIHEHNLLKISNAGGKRVINNNITDARKSAITDGLTKCASFLGIGHKVFKGEQMSDGKAPPKQGNKPQSTGTEEKITKKQLGLLNALLLGLGFETPDEKAEYISRKLNDPITKLEALTKKEGIKIIGDLKELTDPSQKPEETSDVEPF
jgi:hypothetical protein